jgi:2,3-bisphosphoglycerate-independent phosphoglycerate mutase
VVLDGLGDQAHEVLGGRTPLQVAHTPNLDHLALLGGGGGYHPGKVGLAYFSDLALFTALGYTPRDFPGRGVLGCYAAHPPLSPRHIYMLASLVSLEKNSSGEPVLVDRGGDLTPEEWQGALEILAGSWKGEDLTVTFFPLEPGVGVLQIVGNGDPSVTDSDPSHRGGRVYRLSPREGGTRLSQHLAQELNRYSGYAASCLKGASFNRARLEEGKNPLNALLLQGAGRDRFMPSLHEKWGFKGAMVASDSLILGVGRKLDMEVFFHGEGEPRKELFHKFKVSMELMEEYSLVVVHTRDPKMVSKRHNPWEKVRVIEELDTAFSHVVEHLIPREGVLLVIWGGPSTSSGGIYLYAGEPSPLLMVGPRVRKGGSFRFDESSLAYGSLGLLKGEELMLSILSASGRAPLGGRHPHD